MTERPRGEQAAPCLPAQPELVIGGGSNHELGLKPLVGSFPRPCPTDLPQTHLEGGQSQAVSGVPTGSQLTVHCGQRQKPGPDLGADRPWSPRGEREGDG